MALKVVEPAAPAAGEGTPFPILDWEAISAPLPAVPWLNEGLNLAPGRPLVFCGEAGTKKSWWAQAALMTAAVDLPMLGRFPWRKGGLRGLYIDYEQGERESRSRFQSLARGLGVDMRLSGRISYVWQPVETWSPKLTPRAKLVSDLCRLVSGYDLVCVDSLLDCQPGVEENSADVSLPLKVATTVSETTGAAFVFIDHASGKAGASRANAQRGHTAKKGASSVLLVASGMSPEPVTVTCERSQCKPYDQWPKPFGYDLRRVRDGIALEPVEVKQEGESLVVNTTARVLSYVEENPGCSATSLAEALGVRKGTVVAMTQSLIVAGHLCRDRGGLYVPSPDGELPL